MANFERQYGNDKNAKHKTYTHNFPVELISRLEGLP